MISARNKILCSKQTPLSSYILVEFEDFLDSDAEWARLSPFGNSTVTVSGIACTYYDYFKSFPEIHRDLNFWDGGLQSIGNLTLQLNNSNGLMRDLIGDSVLYNTKVKIYILLSTGGELNRDNAELRFVGLIDNVHWEEDVVKITLIDYMPGVYDKDLLTTKVTKEDYPNVNDNIDGTYLPMIGGKWNSNVGNNSIPFDRVAKIDCACPIVETDPVAHEFLIADHPLSFYSGTSYVMKTNTRSDTYRPFSQICTYDDTSKSMWFFYNGSAELTSDNLTKITLSENQTLMQTFLFPERKESGAEIVNEEAAYDRNLFIETGRNAHSRFRLSHGGYIYFYFPSTSMGDIDPFSSGVYLECTGTTGTGQMRVKTDGKNYVYVVDNDYFWILERSTNTYYVVRPLEAPGHGFLDSDFIVTLSDVSIPIQSINLYQRMVGDGGIYFDAENPNYNLVFHYRRINDDGTFTQVNQFAPIPPENISSAQGQWDGSLSRMKYQIAGSPGSWEDVIWTSDRSNKWSWGFYGTGRFENIYLRVIDVPYNGEVLTYPGNLFLSSAAKVGGMFSSTVRQSFRKYSENKLDEYYKKLMEDRAATLNNVSAMVAGYSTDNSAGGTVAENPVEHIKYCLLYRCGVSSSNIDSSFNTVESVRTAGLDSDYTDFWTNHIYVNSQISAFTYLNKLAKENNCCLYYWGEDFKLIDRDLWNSFTDRNSVVCQIDETQILEWKFDKQEEVYDSFKISYANDPSTSTYRRNLYMDWEGNTNWYQESDEVFNNALISNYDIDGYTKAGLLAECAACHNTYFSNDTKKHELEVSLDYLQETDVARRYLIDLIKLYTKQRNVVTFTCGKIGMLLELGSVVYLSHTDWRTSDYGNYLVTSISEQLEDLTFKIEAIKVE